MSDMTESEVVTATGNIRLNCFVRGETVNNIFDVVIDNNLTVNDLKDKIKNTRQDLQEIDFDLYKKNFFQDNVALISTVNTTEERQGELMEPRKKISQYFS